MSYRLAREERRDDRIDYAFISERVRAAPIAEDHRPVIINAAADVAATNAACPRRVLELDSSSSATSTRGGGGVAGGGDAAETVEDSGGGGADALAESPGAPVDAAHSVSAPVGLSPAARVVPAAHATHALDATWKFSAHNVNVHATVSASAPSLHDRVPDNTVPASHLGTHVSPCASADRHAPSAPFVGAETLQHDAVLGVFEVQASGGPFVEEAVSERSKAARNAIVCQNMSSVLIPDATFQQSRAWLNEWACLNMYSMLITEDTSHPPMSALNALAPLNIEYMLVTEDTSHLPMSALKDTKSSVPP